LFIHITLETAPNEMQCDETIRNMVTADRSYFRTLQNACMTAGKTTMTAGKIFHGCFEMLSWPHCTSANIISRGESKPEQPGTPFRWNNCCWYGVPFRVSSTL